MRALLLLPLLAACAAPNPPGGGGDVRPVEVTLYSDTVTALMSDGTLCTGVREARSGPWATRLAGCPHPWAVGVRRTTARARLPLAPRGRDPWVALDPPEGGTLGFAPAGAGG